MRGPPTQDLGPQQCRTQTAESQPVLGSVWTGTFRKAHGGHPSLLWRVIGLRPCAIPIYLDSWTYNILKASHIVHTLTHVCCGGRMYAPPSQEEEDNLVEWKDIVLPTGTATELLDGQVTSAPLRPFQDSR